MRNKLTAVCCVFTLVACIGVTEAATITVTSTGDAVAVDGLVSLREAIDSINAGANTSDVVAVGAYGSSDTINFGIAGAGGHVIALTSPLPLLTEPVTINGYSQGPGTPNSAVTGDNSVHNLIIDGAGAGAFADCLTLSTGSSGSTIRGVVIDSCQGFGIFIQDSQNNVIAGSFIGTDNAGSGAAGNGTGIVVFAGAGQDIAGNQIGGPLPADRNVISANTTRGITVSTFGGGTSSNILIRNNYIGMNAAGTNALGGGQGIFMNDAQGVTIGGASGSLGGSCSGVCNLIAGNGGPGVGATGPATSGLVIQGNFFGTNVTGTLARPNGVQTSISIASDNPVTIGGSAAGTGNLISGQGALGAGLTVSGPGLMTIQGNFIGTTTTGNATLGNAGPGIHVFGAPNVLIGGTVAGTRNVIGGNGAGLTPDGPGILLEGNLPSATATATIQGNHIGIGNNGSSNIGNLGNGIEFMSSSTGSVVGPAVSGGAGGNIIAFNGAGRTNGAGIGMGAGNTANKVFTNSIFSNTGITTGLGIDLSALSSPNTDGPTANDNCDADTGGNDLQNFPVLTSALTSGSSIQIAGSLNSIASATFTVEFFSNGAGTQARTYLGSTSVITGPGCSNTFNANLVQAVAAGENITATATDAAGNTSEISAAIAATTPPPTVTKSFTPTSIGVNGSSLLTITLTNADTSPYTGAAISDTYPLGLVNVSPAPGAATTCGGTVTAVAGSNSVSLTGGTIPASGNCNITVNVTSSSAGSYLNTTGNVTGSGAPSAGGGSATLTVLNRPTISKGFAPTAIPINGTSTLTITLGNSNAVGIAGASFTDTYPSNVVNATPPNASTNCTGGTLTATAGAGSVSLTNTTIPAGGCTVTVSVTSATAGAYNNSIAAGGLTSDAGANTASAAATLTVMSPPGGTKSFSPPGIGPGGTSVLTISLTNSNAIPITGVAFTDTYPANVVNAAVPNASTTCTGGTLTAAAGGGSVQLSGSAIPAGGCNVVVTVTSNVAGTYNNSINAGGVSSTNAGSNTAAISGTLTVNSPPTVSKAFAPTTIAIGGTSTLTITLTNPNAVALTGAAFTDNYPANLVNAAVPNGATSCGGTVTAAAGGTSVALSGGTIPASSSCTVTVNVTSNTAGMYDNTIAAGAVTTTNSGASTAPATATLTVSTLAGPSVSKSFTPSTIPSGGTTTLTITLTNPNGTAITGAAFTDAYNAGLINATPANPATTCGGTVTAANGGSSVALSGGTIPANGACTVTVLVIGTGPASIDNTIPAGGVTSANAAPNGSPASATLNFAGTIPTLSQWMLILLSFTLGVLGLMAVKRA